MARSLVWLLLASALLVLAVPASAYYPDVHYELTYYLARKVGFDQEQAHRLASAAEAIDEDDETEPLQIDEFGPGGDAQTPRFLFHAFMPSRVYADQYARAKQAGAGAADADAQALGASRAACHERFSVLRQQALRVGNPGVYLHYYQDVFCHGKYWSKVGHGMDGCYPDYLVSERTAAGDMVRGSIAQLRWYLHACFIEEPEEVDPAQPDRVVEAVIDANPTGATSFATGPSGANARPVVEAALGESLPDLIQYDFDADGNTTHPEYELPGAHRLTGALRVKVLDDEDSGPLDGAAVEVHRPDTAQLECTGRTQMGLADFDTVGNNEGPIEVRVRMKGYAVGKGTGRLSRDLPEVITVRLKQGPEIARPPAQDDSLLQERKLWIDTPKVRAQKLEVDEPLEIDIEYEAQNVPNMAPEVTEIVTLQGPDGPPIVTRTTRALSQFVWRPNTNNVQDGRGKATYKIVPAKSGNYTCKVELEADGYPPAAPKGVAFSVGDRRLPPEPERPNVRTWVRGAMEVGRDNTTSNPEFESVTGSSAEYREKAGGQERTNKVTWTEPPGTIRDGDRLTVTMQATRAEYAQIEAAYTVGCLADAKTTPDVTWVSTDPGADPDLYAAQMTVEGRWEPSPDWDQVWVSVGITHQRWRDNMSIGPSVVVKWKYTLQGTAPADDGAPGDPGGTTTIADVTGTQQRQEQGEGAGLAARLESTELTLVPGEPSQIDGIYVRGWRSNTEDRVEVLIDVESGFGELTVNPQLVVSPGPTSEAPANMSNAGVSDKREYYFSEMWSAKRDAPAGTTDVPIIVRQKGAGEVRLRLALHVGSAGTGFAGRPPGLPQIAVRPPKGDEAETPGGEGMDEGGTDEGHEAGGQAVTDALALMDAGKPDEAKEKLQAAAQADPKCEICWFSLAMVCEATNDFAGAEQAYRQLVRLLPEDGTAHAQLAVALFRQGKQGEARTEAQEARRLGLQDHEVFGLLGM